MKLLSFSIIAEPKTNGSNMIIKTYDRSDYQQHYKKLSKCKKVLETIIIKKYESIRLVFDHYYILFYNIYSFIHLKLQ